jgi:hypothetical protein
MPESPWRIEFPNDGLLFPWIRPNSTGFQNHVGVWRQESWIRCPFQSLNRQLTAISSPWAENRSEISFHPTPLTRRHSTPTPHSPPPTTPARGCSARRHHRPMLAVSLPAWGRSTGVRDNHAVAGVREIHGRLDHQLRAVLATLPEPRHRHRVREIHGCLDRQLRGVFATLPEPRHRHRVREIHGRRRRPIRTGPPSTSTPSSAANAWGMSSSSVPTTTQQVISPIPLSVSIPTHAVSLYVHAESMVLSSWEVIGVQLEVDMLELD